MDLLAIISGVGLVVSSGITLVVSFSFECVQETTRLTQKLKIFFPQSTEGEIAMKEASREQHHWTQFRVDSDLSF